MRRLLALATLLLTLALPLATFAQGVAKPPAEGLTAAEKKEAEAIFRDYFAARTWAEKQAAAARLAPLDHPSKADVGRLAQYAFALTKTGPRVEAKGSQTCTHPDYPGTYIVSGATRSGGAKGLFISLHGGGAGVGDGQQIASLFGSPGVGCINVYPTVIQKDNSAWNTEREEQYVLAIIEELKRAFTIDTNRIYLAGHSMGGYGTWSIGTKHADLFAAISPQQGGLFVGGRDADGKLIVDRGSVYNLRNTPIWFYNSKDDPRVSPDSSIRAAEILDEMKAKYGPFDFVWKLYDDIGHGTAKEGLSPIWKWMLAKKRDPLPKQVLWEPSREYKRHFYWLRRESAQGAFDVAREGNKFTVTGTSAGLWICVNEKMVKMDQPVVVVDAAGKELFNGVVKPSLVPLLETIEAKRDPESWFPAWIELK